MKYFRQLLDPHPERKPSFLFNLMSFIIYAARRFLADGMMLAAGALTFSTLLALVPLTVIAFAVLSGFATFDPARARMESLFFEIFVPEVGAEVGNYLSEFSSNAANLTALGIVALAVTAVMLLWTIEATLNQIWRVEKPRSMHTRVLIYWTVLTLGPLLLGASFVLTSSTFTTLSQWARDGVAVVRSQDTLPILSLIFAFLTQFLTFTLLFKLVPARPVQLRDAAVGGFLAGAGVQILRWSFDSFLSRGSTYETIYGAVAILPIFLFWLYLSWIVVILGAVFAASLPEWRKPHNSEFKEDFSQSQKLRNAVAALSVLAHKARDGQTTPLPELQETALLDMRDELFEGLLKSGYIVVTENDHISLLRDLHVTTLADLARDLNLAIGLPAEPTDDPARCDAVQTQDALTQMLRALHDAETAILSTSLNDLIFAEGSRRDRRHNSNADAVEPSPVL